MRRIDKFRSVLQWRLLQDTVAQVHDVTIPASCPVEYLFCALPDKLLGAEERNRV